MSMFTWHTDSESRGAPPATPQLRWLPSVLQRTPNTLPAISSTLQPRAQAALGTDTPASETPRTSDSGDSESRPSSRDAGTQDAPGDVDYAPTPAADQAEEPRSAVARLISGLEPDTPRKHGKRLTTKEEVRLFEICNRYSATFGERNRLCEWWQMVTNEFTREQGHPYSWHSVRRKIELVTKQRIKFLADQRKNGGGQDLSNPQWREAIDAWVPTWERFEDAEAKRIETRDARKGRKRKDRPWESTKPWETTAETWRASSSSFGNNSVTTMPAPPALQASAPTSPAVRLPPGFDSMFSRPPLAGIGDAARGAGYPSAPAYSHTPPTVPPASADPSVTSAVLETLNKLNKHLDAAASNSRSSPIVSALVATTESSRHQSSPEPNAEREESTEKDDSGAIPNDAIPPSSSILDKLKEELRAEFHRELEKDRTALEEKLDSVQRTQEMILDLLRQEPA